MGCGSSKREPLTFTAVCPQNGRPGQYMKAMVNGKQMDILIPPGAVPGKVFRFDPNRPAEIAGSKASSPKKKKAGLEDAFTREDSIVRDSFFEVETSHYRESEEQARFDEIPSISYKDSGSIKAPVKSSSQAAPAPAPAPSPAPAPAPVVAPAATPSPKPVATTPTPAPVAASTKVTTTQVTPVVVAVPTPAPVVAPQVTAPPGGIIQVSIPQGTQPGQYFEVFVNGNRLALQAPPGSYPGMIISVQTPSSAPPTPPPSATSTTLDVVVPQGVQSGQTFEVVYNGLKIGVQCPPNVKPGQQIRIQVPISTTPRSTPCTPAPAPGSAPASPTGKKTYQIAIPPGVVGGQQFEVVLDGKRVGIMCPAGVREGQKIEIAI